MHWPLRKKRQRRRKRRLRKKRQRRRRHRLRRRLLPKRKRRLRKKRQRRRRRQRRRKLPPKNGRFFSWVVITPDGACSIRRFFESTFQGSSRPSWSLLTGSWRRCVSSCPCVSPPQGSRILLLTPNNITWNDLLGNVHLLHRSRL